MPGQGGAFVPAGAGDLEERAAADRDERYVDPAERAVDGPSIWREEDNVRVCGSRSWVAQATMRDEIAVAMRHLTLGDRMQKRELTRARRRGRE